MSPQRRQAKSSLSSDAATNRKQPRQAEPLPSDEIYRAVLADLYRKKDEICAAIAALERFLAPTANHSIVKSLTDPSSPGQVILLSSTSVVSDAVLAALKALGGVGRNAEIKRVMIASGFKFKGDPIVSISQCLARLAAMEQVERVERGNWRLK